VLKYLKKLGLFIIPFICILILVYAVDSYVIFDNELIIQNKDKKKISNKLNYQLWKWSDFRNTPNENILLGDSRMANLSTDSIYSLTGLLYSNMAFGGGTIPEAIETFWYCSNNVKLKNVIIGINFSMYNEYNSLNRCIEAKSILQNPIRYFNNQSVIKSTFYLLRDYLFELNKQIEKPPFNKEQFWNYQLTVSARNLYSNYKYPSKLYNELLEIKNYCTEKNINLSFVEFPVHTDLLESYEENGRYSEYNRMKQDLSSLGETYDFNDSNERNKNKGNFTDPFHYTDEYMTTIIKELFHLNL